MVKTEYWVYTNDNVFNPGPTVTFTSYGDAEEWCNERYNDWSMFGEAREYQSQPQVYIAEVERRD